MHAKAPLSARGGVTIGAGRHATVLAVFSATLLISAFLLFSVQPVFAKMVLPTLGGSPAVWAISMCFFQAVLLAGYCYAHLLNRYLGTITGPIVHLLTCLLAALSLPFGLPADVTPPPGDAYLWLVGILGAGVGLPFFAVSANAPLLQAWFARSGHPHAKDPYFLYGASNLGSLLALLAYPFLIEPVIGLGLQARIWSGGFLLLVAMLMTSALATAAAGGIASATMPTPATPETSMGVNPTWRDRAIWTGLAFVPSGLLTAFTTHVTTDIASAPFLWVLPLAIFLATFILVFRDTPVLSHALLSRMQPVFVAATLLGLTGAGSTGWKIGTIGSLGAFFVTTMICHRELYDRRPQSGHLTEFYIWMSAGGVLGGTFAAIVAPQIFNALYELPLLLVLGMLCRPGFAAELADASKRADTQRVALAGAGALLVLALIAKSGVIPQEAVLNCSMFVVVVFGALLILANGHVLRQAALGALAASTLAVLPTAMSQGSPQRSFFGVMRVIYVNDGKFREFWHGVTTHGVERVKTDSGEPVTHPVPASYYHPGSPMAQGIEIARQIPRTSGQPFSGGIIGVGAGSLICYAQPHEHWRYYEIDPMVIEIARRDFSFINRCRADADIVIGDGRLMLARELTASFDYLVIDAFSSDAIPVHLLTREALLLYFEKLRPDGLLALHISNRHLELESVVTAAVATMPGVHAATVIDVPTKLDDAYPSRVMMLSKSEATLAPVLALKGARPAAQSDAAVWTDDYSDILSALWRSLTGKN